MRRLLPVVLFVVVGLYLWLSGALEQGHITVDPVGAAGPVEEPASPAAREGQPAVGPASARTSLAAEVEDELPHLPRALLGAVSGRLLRASDRSPVAGVELYLAELDTESLSRPWTSFAASTALGSPVRMLARTHSDDAGRFKIEAVRPRGIRVLGIGPGGPWVGMRVLSDDPPRGGLVDIGDVLLADRGQVAGTIVGADGEPIAGATIRAVDLPPALGDLAMKRFDPLGAMYAGWGEDEYTVVPMPSWLRELEPDLPFPCARSDEAGRFVLDGVPAGKATLIVQAPTEMPMTREVAVKAGMMREVGKLRLRGGKDLTGQVVDEAGTALAGLRLRCGEEVFGMGIGFLTSPVETDVEGRFRLSGVGRRAQRLFVQRTPRSRWRHVGEHLPGVDARIVLPATCSVRLEVRAADGAPATEARLELLPRDQIVMLPGLFRATSEPIAVEPTGESGCWTATGLETGAWRVLCRAPGHAPAVADFTAVAGPPTTVRLMLDKGREVRIRVEDRGGAPVAAARVFWLDPKPATADGQLLQEPLDEFPLCLGATDRDGRLVVSDLPRLPLGLQVEHPGYGSVLSRLAAEQDDVTLVMLRGATVVGQVLERGGPPDRRLTVVASSEGDGDPDPSEHLMPHLCRTDAEGRFRFDGLEEGAWSIEVLTDLTSFKGIGEFVQAAMQDRMDWKAVTVELRDGVEQEVVIRLDEEAATGPGVVEGSLRLDGKPVEGVRVLVWADRSFKGRTDAQGRFRVEGLPQQEVWVSLQDAGRDVFGERTLWNDSIDLSANPVAVLDLDFATATLELEVVDRDGKPLDGWYARLELTAPPAGTRAGDADYVGMFKDDGKLRLPGIRHGTYRVEVEAMTEADLRVAPRTFTIPTDGLQQRFVAVEPISVGGELVLVMDGLDAALRKELEQRLAATDPDQATVALGESEYGSVARKDGRWSFRFDKLAPQDGPLWFYAAGIRWSAGEVRFDRARPDHVVRLRPGGDDFEALRKEVAERKPGGGEGAGSGR